MELGFCPAQTVSTRHINPKTLEVEMANCLSMTEERWSLAVASELFIIANNWMQIYTRKDCS